MNKVVFDVIPKFREQLHHVFDGGASLAVKGRLVIFSKWKGFVLVTADTLLKFNNLAFHG